MISPRRSARVARYRSGYLLLEVLLAVAVLSISVVMIFKIIQTTLKVTSDINFLQTQQRKVDGIFELLRRNFNSMPATCTFQTRTVNSSLELIFRNAPFNFSWVAAGEKIGTVTDFFGNTIFEAKAPASGIVLYICAVPSMRKGDTIANVGTVAPRAP